MDVPDPLIAPEATEFRISGKKYTRLTITNGINDTAISKISHSTASATDLRMIEPIGGTATTILPERSL